MPESADRWCNAIAEIVALGEMASTSDPRQIGVWLLVLFARGDPLAAMCFADGSVMPIENVQCDPGDDVVLRAPECEIPAPAKLGLTAVSIAADPVQSFFLLEELDTSQVTSALWPALLVFEGCLILRGELPPPRALTAEAIRESIKARLAN